MGSKVSPSFAILYMGWFEDQFVYTYELQPLLYVRFIDDIFMIWQHSEEELLTFIEHLNNCKPNIKFSHEISKTEINFLDIKIIQENNVLRTTLYTKPTDSHDYVLYSSAHPQICKDSIPYSQFLRIRRICSNIDDFDLNAIFLSQFFLRRGYPLELVQNAALLARRKDRAELLNHQRPTTQETQNSDRIFLITTYHPNDSTLKDIIFKNWKILGSSTTTRHIYEKRLMVGYRRPKNLRDLLVRAKIPFKPQDSVVTQRPDTTTNPTVVREEPTPSTSSSRQTTLDQFLVPGIKPTPGTHNSNLTSTKRKGTGPKELGFNFCNKNNCNYCKLLNKTGTITCHVTGLEYTSMSNVSCRSSNLIYCISCRVCGKQYVGQTLRRMRDRLSEHLRDMDKADLSKPLGLHFTKHVDHPIEVTILEFIKKAPRSPQAQNIRNRVERRWIHLLRTPIPWGLNLED